MDALSIDILREIQQRADITTASRMARAVSILAFDPRPWLITYHIEQPFAIWQALPNGRRHGSASVQLIGSTARFVYNRGKLVSMSQRGGSGINIAWLGSRRVEVVGPARAEVCWADPQTRITHTAVVDSRDEYVRVTLAGLGGAMSVIRAIARPAIDFDDAAAIATWFNYEYVDSAPSLHATEFAVRGRIPPSLHQFFMVDR